MPRTDYPKLQVIHDTTAFLETPLGKHRIKQLEYLRELAINTAQNPDLTDNYRAHRMTEAATYAKIIDVFKTAEIVQDSPELMKRLRDKEKERSKKQAKT